MDPYLAEPQNKYIAKAFLGITVEKQKGKKLITWGSVEVSKTSNFILIWSVCGSPSAPEGRAFIWAPPFWTASLSLIFPHRPTSPSNRACLSRCVSKIGCGHIDFQILPEPRNHLLLESLHHGFFFIALNDFFRPSQEFFTRAKSMKAAIEKEHGRSKPVGFGEVTKTHCSNFAEDSW